jgi:site-specific DNA-methyltransferase (adenine-specific)
MGHAILRRSSAKLIIGDAVKEMSKIQTESIDLIFADPPYFLSNNGFTVHAGQQVSVNKGDWDKSRGFTGDWEFHESWIKECRRLLKPNGTIWISGTHHSVFICGAILQRQGWHVLNDIIWYKRNASPNLSCRMFTASHETLIWARKSKKTKHYFDYRTMKATGSEIDSLKNPGKQMRSVWSIGPVRSPEKTFGKHPTQKPIALLDRIIRASSRPGQTVLDPFCGSGTTGVSAISNGRSFIGIDSHPEYLRNIAKPRIIAAMKDYGTATTS